MVAVNGPLNPANLMRDYVASSPSPVSINFRNLLRAVELIIRASYRLNSAYNSRCSRTLHGKKQRDELKKTSGRLISCVKRSNDSIATCIDL
jgi:hypothetical protein